MEDKKLNTDAIEQLSITREQKDKIINQIGIKHEAFLDAIRKNGLAGGSADGELKMIIPPESLLTNGN